MRETATLFFLLLQYTSMHGIAFVHGKVTSNAAAAEASKLVLNFETGLTLLLALR